MKTVTAYLSGAALLALAGAICLMAGLLDRDLARAEEHIIASEYGELQPILQRAGRVYEYARLVPWIGSSPLNEMRAREAALEYWQRRYAGLIPDQADPLAAVPPDNVDLQFLMANAIFRDGQAAAATARDKATLLGALDAAASAYQTVLRNADRHHDAAYNYEYMIRLRSEVDKGRLKTLPPPSTEREGSPGRRPEDSVDDARFKVYVPLEQEQIDKRPPGEAGKQAPIRKRG
jgi:hypothetical protein